MKNGKQEETVADETGEAMIALADGLVSSAEMVSEAIAFPSPEQVWVSAMNALLSRQTDSRVDDCAVLADQVVKEYNKRFTVEDEPVKPRKKDGPRPSEEDDEEDAPIAVPSRKRGEG